MATTIRLKRFGTKKRPHWRIVVSDTKMPRDGRFIESIGHYDPLPTDEKVVLKKERFEYWVGKGAQVSTSVRNLIRRSEKKSKKA